MALPEAVQRQLDAADVMLNTLVPPGKPETDPDQPNAADGNPTPNAADAAPTPAAPAPAPTPSVDFEQKYRVMQGKYDAEVPRLQQENRELRAAMSTLSEQVAALTATRQEPPQSLITDADKEAFGEDLINLVDRATEQKVGPLKQENEQLRRQLAQLQQNTQSVAQTVQLTAQQQFVADLDKAVPNWRTVNTDNGFLVWLGQPDPVFGVQRQMALNAAYERLDAQGTANVFLTYLQTLPQQPTTPVRSPKDDLQSQVAPTRSRAAAAPAPDELSTKVFRESEIGQIYNDIRRGQYTIAEQERLEEAIGRAAAEGRVIPGQ